MHELSLVQRMKLTREMTQSDPMMKKSSQMGLLKYALVGLAPPVELQPRRPTSAASVAAAFG